MRGRQLNFYATQADIHGLGIHLSKGIVQFAHTDVPQGANPVVYQDIADLQSMQTYVAIPVGQEIIVSHVELVKGGRRSEVDIEKSIGAVRLSLGGFATRERLLPGQFGTSSTNPAALATYKLLADVIRRRFETIKSYRVGPEAARLLDNGTRLAPTEKSPREYDLAR